MNKDDYLDKKIPEGTGEPSWFNPYREKRLTQLMHKLQDRWDRVYRKIKKERLF